MIAAALRAQRQVTDEVWAKYDEISNRVVTAIAVAANGMAAYKRGSMSEAQVQFMLNALTGVIAELEAYYLSKVPVEKQKPLLR